MARTKSKPRSLASMSVNKPSANGSRSAKSSATNSSHSSGSIRTDRPKCKLYKTFPSIRPKGCKVKKKQVATSPLSVASRSTKSSGGSRGTQARSESVIPRDLDDERYHRNMDNVVKYYGKRTTKSGGYKYKGRKDSTNSWPQGSQSSRAS